MLFRSSSNNLADFWRFSGIGSLNLNYPLWQGQAAAATATEGLANSAVPIQPGLKLGRNSGSLGLQGQLPPLQSALPGFRQLQRACPRLTHQQLQIRPQGLEGAGDPSPGIQAPPQGRGQQRAEPGQRISLDIQIKRQRTKAHAAPRLRHQGQLARGCEVGCGEPLQPQQARAPAQLSGAQRQARP